MKIVTNDYKNNIKQNGRILDSKITYELNGETIELGKEDLNSVEPHYKTSILKSAMKQLDIDCNVEIPLETVVNYQFGVLVDDEYEYINYGNYVVYKVEKQEDLKSYKITCYDKMLYSMKEYEDMNITYPITIANYINAICQHLGLTFKDVNIPFANYNRQIAGELYLDSNGNSLGYTFRDVLDELAQVTASVICINEETDELEIRYINDTNDTIDEEYFKNINVTFGEKYGPVNSIVLSRTVGEDNVYLKDDQSIEQNGLCEIKIKDNQIMNFNDRSDYLADIFSKLAGLEYYINDFSSTGITFYELCDKYTAQIDEKPYTCIMFGDDVNVTRGLVENIKNTIPEQGETDYSKADKTDRKLNQTYLIVDKQNQVIQGVVSQVDGQNEQIAEIRLQYNELISKIGDIADITTSGESSYASVNLLDVNASQPIAIKIHPIIEHVSYLYPHYDSYPTNQYYPAKNGLKPSNSLTPSNSLVPSTGYSEQFIKYPKSRTLRFTNTTTDEVFDWVLPTDLWYLNDNTYDELELSYGDGINSSVIVTRKCSINSYGKVKALATPTTETYPYPDNILLTDGDYTITLLDNTSAYLYVQLMAKNIYTSQFYTKAETNSIINQTATSIDLSVNQKLSNYSTTNEMNAAINVKANEINQTVSQKVGINEVISRINQTPEQITINASKLNLQGYITATDLSGSGRTTINGANITTGTISANRVSGGTLTGTTISGNTITGGTVNGTSISGGSITIGTNFSVNSSGKMVCNNAEFKGELIGASFNGGKIYLKRRTNDSTSFGQIECESMDANGTRSIATAWLEGGRFRMASNTGGGQINMTVWDEEAFLGVSGEVNAENFVKSSLATKKKNFEKFSGALEIINSTDIYKYHYKNQKDDEKKDVGLVIGKDYNYSQLLTNQKNDSVNIASMIGVCFQAIKEQQEQIELLKKEIESLKKESDN